jgi:hypothetical protein
MANIWPREVSEAFKAKIEPLIPAPERDPFNLQRHQPGGGKKPMPPRQIDEAMIAISKAGAIYGQFLSLSRTISAARYTWDPPSR